MQAHQLLKRRRVWRTAQSGVALCIEVVPTLGPTQVEVEIAAFSLNFRDMPFIERCRDMPRIPCSDAVGVVRSVGEDVRRVAIGQRVCITILPQWLDGPITHDALTGALGSADADGVAAEVIVVDETACVVPPRELSDIQASTLPCAALTAWHAVAELGEAKAGDWVAIETTGGVALFALQFARAMGCRVAITSRNRSKLQRALKLGAEVAIDTSTHPEWHERLLEATGGVGAGLVVDMGLHEGLSRSCKAARPEGTVAIVGVVSGWSTRFDIGTVMNRNLRVRGVETGSRAMFERMNVWITAHRLEPVVAAVHEFGRLPEALKELAHAPFGKVVVSL